MQKQIIISVYADKQTKELLEKWALEQERSISYIIRKLVKKEAQSKEQKPH